MSKKNTRFLQQTMFKEIEHTADRGIEVSGNSIADLFKNALFGMYSLALFLPEPLPEGQVKVELKEMTLEDLLVSFLSEFNFRLYYKHEYCCEINKLDIRKIKNYYCLELTGTYTTLNEAALSGMEEIKSVTYHQMQISNKNGTYRTKIIFDT